MNTQLKIGFIFLLVLLAIGCTRQEALSKIYISELNCENLPNPSVVDVSNPRLSWINKSNVNERGQKQTAYQIRVATSLEGLQQPDLWDSEKTLTEESIRILYNGKKLSSKQECWWQVRVWDKDNIESDWSEPGKWRMGLLQPSDWKADWIGAPWQGEEALPRTKTPNEKSANFGPPAPLLRKEFEVKKKIEKAVAYVTGLGYFEFYANGQKVGDDVLVPNQTNFGKRPSLPNSYLNIDDNFSKYKVMYLAYDIKDFLKNGKNVIGGILGNGFYNPAKFWTEGYGTPRFMCQVHIMYKDGTEKVIKSDTSWKASKSAILMDMVYYGEYYDARKEQPGWCTPDFDATAWDKVALKKAPEGELVAHTAYTDKVTEQIKPITIEKLKNGNYIVDFGEEISGWVRLNNVEGPAGHKIEIAYNANQYSGDSSYIFKGDGPENHAPRFNWFVFSGIEIKNWPGELKAEYLTAEAVNTYIEESATFETSNTLFNTITKIWKRSQTDNMHGGIVSDCPHRERSGYTGDGQVACVTVMHNYDAKNFYYKWINDILDAQNVDTGYVPNCAPWQPGCGGGVAWGAAVSIMPWEYYVHYGDKDMLVKSYEAMKAYIRYMQTWVNDDGIMFSKRKNGSGEVIMWFNLGEWAPAEKLVRDDLVHTFYYWRCVDIASKTAQVLGNLEEYNTYKELANAIKNAFYKEFYDPKKGTYGNWGGDVFALKMGVPEVQYTNVKKSLEANIKANKGHLDTGIFGTRFFFEVLAENGLNHLAYEALNKKDEPSFGYWITLGSTTTREQWDNSNSHNHPMFGGGLVWLYRNLAGMQADPYRPGYKHIIYRPQPIGDLSFVTYKNKTPYGDAGISWKNKKDAFYMDVTVPIGSTATVYVPTNDKNSITEGNKAASKSDGLKFSSIKGNYVIYEAVSGTYNFKVKKSTFKTKVP